MYHSFPLDQCAIAKIVFERRAEEVLVLGNQIVAYHRCKSEFQYDQSQAKKKRSTGSQLV